MSVKISGTLSKKLYLFLSTTAVVVSVRIIGEINGAEWVPEPVLGRSEPINIIYKPQYKQREPFKIISSPLLAEASPQTVLPSPPFTDNSWFNESPEKLKESSSINQPARENLLPRLYEGLLVNHFMDTINLDKFFDLREDMGSSNKIDILLDALDYESKLRAHIYLAQKGDIGAQRALWKEVIGGSRSPRSIQKGKETLYFLMKMMQEIERHFYTHVIDVCFTTEKISKSIQWRKVVEKVKNEIYGIKEHIKDLINKPATLITCLHIPLWECNYISDIMMTNNVVFQEYSKSRYLALGNNREIMKNLFTVYRGDMRETPIRLSTLFSDLKSFYNPDENFNFYKLAEQLNNNASLFRGHYLKCVHDAQDYLNNLFLVSIGWKV